MSVHPWSLLDICLMPPNSYHDTGAENRGYQPTDRRCRENFCRQTGRAVCYLPALHYPLIPCLGSLRSNQRIESVWLLAYLLLWGPSQLNTVFSMWFKAAPHVWLPHRHIYSVHIDIPHLISPTTPKVWSLTLFTQTSLHLIYRDREMSDTLLHTLFFRHWL